MKNERLKGYFLAIIATLALANVYIFSKAALNELHIFQFGFYWFGFALLWNTFFIIFRKKKLEIKQLDKNSKFAISGNVFFEVIGTVLFFTGINVIENPAIVSFLVNLGPVFTLILGFFLLNERYNFIEYNGILITIIGIFIINYNGNNSFDELYKNGTWIVILGALFFSIALIIAKKNIHKIEPIILATSRAIVLFVISLILMFVYKLNFLVSINSIINVIIGSLMGPFLSFLASYYSLKYIEASLSNVILSTKSLFIIIGAYFFFNLMISQTQLIGGLISVFGIVIISLGKKIWKTKKKLLRK
ncbi:MAG: DMT family transporter [Bacteroidales bacterium]|nr:DMT family transporter [Bacteroidales bacterium]MBN2758670.1 DMT family transporter [Bacteroidales bacterium]